MRNKTVTERGTYKQKVNAALFKSQAIRDMLIGDTTGMSASEIRDKFKYHVKSHLFIDDTIEETDTFIFYDVQSPRVGETIKTVKLYIYVVCHRDILDECEYEGYTGNRADILSEMICDVLINDEDVTRSFGIGKLQLDSVDIYNSKRFYGCVLQFDVPNFS